MGKCIMWPTAAESVDCKVSYRACLIVATHRAATAGKAPKAWALPRVWVSIHSYQKQPVKKIWGRILGLA